jgi:hypothetical protein
MERIGKIQRMGKRFAWLLCGALAAGGAVAGAPRVIHGDAATPTPRRDQGRLDLRPPTTVASTQPAATTTSPSSAGPPPFPSMHRIASGPDYKQQLPALGADAAPAARKSTVEELAHRVHREGLPVARLWENHTALVSLGLSPRGKPGLWLIQKVK